MSGARLNVDGRLGLMLTELRLPTVKRLATTLCDQSDREGWPARQLLERVFEHEMSEREVRRFERHRFASGLSPDKRLSTFDFAAVPTVSRARIMALTEGHEWLGRGTNLLAFGPPGSGKSHLLSAVGHALIDAGKRVLFTRCSDLVQRLQAARRDLRLPQELMKLDRFDLLILDDLTYVRRDQAETSVLFELLAERYERRSVAITANTPFSQWGDVFVDPAMTVAAIDRLVRHAVILEMNTESYRRRTARNTQTSKAQNDVNSHSTPQSNEKGAQTKPQDATFADRTIQASSKSNARRRTQKTPANRAGRNA
jgi:DNA replication protein DnaC